jgi:hypothetical protein
MCGATHTAGNSHGDQQEGREETLMERQQLSGIDTFAFTDDRGQRFRLVQTGSRQGRLLARLERYGVDAPGSDRWQAIAESLHIDLALRSTHRPGPARPQQRPTSGRIGTHLSRVNDYLRAWCPRLATRMPRRTKEVCRPIYIPLPIGA